MLIISPSLTGSAEMCRVTLNAGCRVLTEKLSAVDRVSVLPYFTLVRLFVFAATTAVFILRSSTSAARRPRPRSMFQPINRCIKCNRKSAPRCDLYFIYWEYIPVVMYRLNCDRIKYVGYFKGGVRLLSSPKSAAEMGRTWATPTVCARVTAPSSHKVTNFISSSISEPSRLFVSGNSVHCSAVCPRSPLR